MQQISSADARTNFSDMIAKAHYQNQQYVICRSNRPMAVIISIEEFEKLKETEKPAK